MFKTANVTVMVQDIEKALAFYTEVLGLSAGMRHGDNYAEVKAPGVTIVLHPKGNHGPKASKAGNLSIGFQVADVKKVTESMKKKGLSFTFQENEANKFAFFSDPDGTPLYLIQVKWDEQGCSRPASVCSENTAELGRSALSSGWAKRGSRWLNVSAVASARLPQIQNNRNA